MKKILIVFISTVKIVFCLELLLLQIYLTNTRKDIDIIIDNNWKHLINFVHSFTGIGMGYSMSTSVTLQELGQPRIQQGFTTKSYAPGKFRTATRSTATTRRNVVRRFHYESYKNHSPTLLAIFTTLRVLRELWPGKFFTYGKCCRM